MVNLWSREYRELMREGIRPRIMFVADCIFGTTIGVLNLAVFALTIPLFCRSWQPSLTLLLAFPSLVVTSLAVSAFITALVTRLGRSWGFLSWSGLQMIVMISSPFVPFARLPAALQVIALFSPFTYLFEFTRTGESWLLGLAALQGGIMFWLGLYFLERMFQRVRSVQGLHKM